jgi:hypothetical protein
MWGLPLAVASCALSCAFLGLLALSGLVARRASGAEFSFVRYAGWLVVLVALGGAVLVARSPWLARGATLAAVLWLLLFAASDGQAQGTRAKIGFLTLYTGLFALAYVTMIRSGAVVGTRASAAFAYALHEAASRLVLPLPLLIGPAASETPAGLLGVVVHGLADDWVLAVALATFAVAAFAEARLAEHATPKLGALLLPAPTVSAFLLTVLAVLALLAKRMPAVATPARLGVIWLVPFFVAEGLAVLHRVAAPLRSRKAWLVASAAVSLVSPFVASSFAVLGVVAELVRLRALEPVIGAVHRTAARPRLGLPLAAAFGVPALVLVTSALGRAVVLGLSPHVEAAPEICGAVTFAAAGPVVRVKAPSGSFSIDVEETPVRLPASRATVERACTARGARLCTSDEWATACVCSYANESVGGPKLATNDRLLYRVDSERAGARSEGPEVHALLRGRAEIVSAGADGAALLLSGPSDAEGDGFTTDCRYRAFVTESALEANDWDFVSARCCR